MLNKNSMNNHCILWKTCLSGNDRSAIILNGIFYKYIFFITLDLTTLLIYAIGLKSYLPWLTNSRYLQCACTIKYTII